MKNEGLLICAKNQPKHCLNSINYGINYIIIDTKKYEQ